MVKYISFGKLDKKYVIINLFGIFFASVSLMIERKNKDFYVKNKFMNLVGINFGLFLSFIPELIRNRSNSYKRSNSKPYTTKFYILLIIMTALLNLIHNILISLIKGINEEEIRFLQNNNLSFLIIITFFISTLIFKYSYYRHQYLSIVIITLLILFRHLIKIFKTSKYAVEKDKLIIFFCFHIIGLICLSLYIIYLKILFEKYYFSLYKVTYLVGVINGIIVIIIYIIISFKPIEKNNIFGTVEYEGKYYFDNINSFFNGYNLGEIILYFIYYVINSIRDFIMINIIIENYSINYIFLPFNVISILVNIIEIFKFYDFEISLICLLIFSFFCEIISICVYLEIIELNFCGLSENINKNIKKRALEDSKITSDPMNNMFEINNQYLVNYDDVIEKENEDKKAELKDI